MRIIKTFEKDLQKYNKFREKDQRAIDSYEFTSYKTHEAVKEYKRNAETEGIESAIFYSICDAREVGFMQGVRYLENKKKRAKAAKTCAEPTGSAQIRGTDPEGPEKEWTVSYRVIGANEEQIRAINCQLRALGVKVQITEKEVKEMDGQPEQIRGTDPEEKRQYFILIHDYDGATISDDAYIGTRTEAEAEGIRRADQLGGRSYTIAEPVHPVYSMKEWQRDVNFSAYAGQEVTEDIYRQMYNSLLPLDLTEERAAEIRNKYGAEIETGFLMAEPYGSNETGLTYLCFGRSGGKCYFFGEVNK